MKVLNIKNIKDNSITAVATLSDADLENIDLMKQLKDLESKLKDLDYMIGEDGLFEIVEIENEDLFKANAILKGNGELINGLADYVKQLEADVKEFEKLVQEKRAKEEAAKKEAEEAEAEPKRDLAYYQWDIKETTTAMEESGYYD